MEQQRGTRRRFCRPYRKATHTEKGSRLCMCGVKQVVEIHETDCAIVYWTTSKAAYFLIAGECDCKFNTINRRK